MKKNITLIYSFLLLFIFYSNFSKGQPPTLLGGNMTYECTGVNTYRIALAVYVDCLGGTLPDSVSVDWSGVCSGTNSGILTMPKVAGYPIDVTSSIFPGASSCNGGTGVRGVGYYLYIDTLTVPTGCSSIDMSWNTCCRNDSLTSIIAPSISSFYLEMTLSNLSVSCNSSPVFVNIPVIGSCANFASFYNQGAFDPDGDSLNFSLVPCLEDENDPVSYFAAFSGTSPFSPSNPVVINTETGAINYTAPINQTSMFCVLIEEIRGGVVIGTTMREIAVIALNCPINNIPVVTGIDSTNVYDTTVLIGQPFCFDIHGEDADVNQQLIMSWNNGIGGATFTIDTTNNPIGTFCWTPTIQDTGQHVFTVQVSDYASPVPGVVIEGFIIQVNTTLGLQKDNKIDAQKEFGLYPNPAAQKVQLVFDFPVQEALGFKIVDVRGTVVQAYTTIKEARTTLDIQSLATGIYSIVVLTKTGELLTKKLLVQ